MTLPGCEHLACCLLAGCGKRLGSLRSLSRDLCWDTGWSPRWKNPQCIKETVFHVLLLPDAYLWGNCRHNSVQKAAKSRPEI